MSYTPSQQRALEILRTGQNVFVTGAAGTGKSYLLREYLRECEEKPAMLATSGVAAIIQGGRTFHSFFSLWDFQSPYEKMVESAMGNPRLGWRVGSVSAIIIDEVSMLDERTMRAGEEICRRIKKVDAPWGGMRVIAVGDFCQLPPVEKGRGNGTMPNWVFDSQVWRETDFQMAELKEIMRTGDTDFMELLNKVRTGEIDQRVEKYLLRQTVTEDQALQIDGTRIFSRVDMVKRYNKRRLQELPGEVEVFRADAHSGDLLNGEKHKAKLLKDLPVDPELTLKEEALVMIRVNNIDHGYANGSLGHYNGIQNGQMAILLMDGMEVYLDKKEYELKDANGDTILATALQWPVSLAYATTIHKAQGATLDCVVADIGALWESGQAYVAMSRTKTAEKFYVLNWSKRSVLLDPRVKRFYNFS